MRRRDDVRLWLFWRLVTDTVLCAQPINEHSTASYLIIHSNLCNLLSKGLGWGDPTLNIFRVGCIFMCIHGGNREKKKTEEEEREKAPYVEWSQLLLVMLPTNTNSHPTSARNKVTCELDTPKKTCRTHRYRDRISSPHSEGKHHRNCLVVSSEYHTHKRSTDLKAHITQWTHEGTHELPQSPRETACPWDTARQTEVRAGRRERSLSDAATRSERGSEVNIRSDLIRKGRINGHRVNVVFVVWIGWSG